MHIEPVSSIAEVTALLAENGLPTEDLSVSPAPLFFGIREGGELVAVVGLQLFSPSGLLRSLAVQPAFRQHGLGRALVLFAESHAAAHGVSRLFLLTTTADAWFRQRGYAPSSRNDAPPAIRGTAQFSGLCPSAAAFLCKRLDPPDA